MIFGRLVRSSDAQTKVVELVRGGWRMGYGMGMESNEERGRQDEGVRRAAGGRGTETHDGRK
jgi:hypothetical protein